MAPLTSNKEEKPMSARTRFWLFAFSLIAFPGLVFAQKTPGYTFHQINYPGLEHTYVFDVNDRASAGGDVVGVAHRLNEWGAFEPVYFTKYGSAYLPFEIEGTEYANPDAINNHRVVAGVYRVTGEPQIWAGFAHIGSSKEHPTTETERIAVPGGTKTEATGINDAGTVVGYYVHPGDDKRRGFILQGGVYADLPLIEGWEVYPFDVNNLGQVVGVVIQVGTYLNGMKLSPRQSQNREVIEL
jgi:hypothetical protein